MGRTDTTVPALDVSVIGLGKLGSPLAAWIASKGHKVIGVDVNQQFVDSLSIGQAPVEEPGLQKLLDSFRFEEDKGPLWATKDIKGAVMDTDITFIVVPTPSTASGAFSNRYLKQAMVSIGKALRHKPRYHLVVIVSTVMPGTTQAMRKLLQKYSKKKCGSDFGLCYNPEFIALGNVLNDLSYPDFVLIGESDDIAGDMLERFYWRAHYVDFTGSCYVGPKFARTSFINAEIAKLALNCFVTTKISFANMIGRVCDDIRGADADEVTQAIGMDTRIGPKFLKAGTPFGGPCFPRDNEAFMSIMPRTSYSLPLATKGENALTMARIVNRVAEHVRDDDIVGVVGVAYKPGTSVTEESAGIKLVNALSNGSCGLISKVLTWDEALQDYGQESLQSFASRCDVIVFMLPYKGVMEAKYHFEGKVIIDPWRIIESDTLPESTTYVPLGRG